MENKIVITPEIVKNATDYIPLMKKQEMAETIAQKCIVKVLMKYTEKGDGTDSVPMPDRYQEYHMYTNLYLMGVLAHEYLHIPYEGDGTGKEIIDYENLKIFNTIKKGINLSEAGYKFAFPNGIKIPGKNKAIKLDGVASGFMELMADRTTTDGIAFKNIIEKHNWYISFLNRRNNRC